jgi:hypothetical protein
MSSDLTHSVERRVRFAIDRLVARALAGTSLTWLPKAVTMPLASRRPQPQRDLVTSVP